MLQRDIEHGYDVESGETTLLSLFQPAGLDGCFEELSRGGGVADFERLVTVAARHGVEITGPRPEPIGGDGPVSERLSRGHGRQARER